MIMTRDEYYSVFLEETAEDLIRNLSEEDKEALRQSPDYALHHFWLGKQSLDLFIPSLKMAIEYQGIQHYQSVAFFGGEDALAQRQKLDAQKRQLCEENNVRLIEWPYSMEPTDEGICRMLTGMT